MIKFKAIFLSFELLLFLNLLLKHINYIQKIKSKVISESLITNYKVDITIITFLALDILLIQYSNQELVR